MASGHVNRINRPNTWLHRPMLLREVLTCQPGAVHTWHLADLRLADNYARSKRTLNGVLSPSRNVYSAFALRRQVGTCHGRSHDNQMIGTYEFSQPSSRSQEVPSTFPPLEAFCRQEPAAASKVN